ncbi:MAG: L,D-transpeptidase [Rhizobiaceae bacterium]
MKRFLTTLCAATIAATAAMTAAPAPAEAGVFSKFMQGGQERVNPVKRVAVRNSNASPIPRETVRFDEPASAGTIIVETSERRLYYVLGNGLAIKYAIGVARPGFEWAGTNRISRKAEWPDWRPPAEMIAREARKGRKLPAFMAGGPNNPLGARAMYLGSTIYRIHGTNQPWTIDKNMSSGCIRMANDDVTHLYQQAKIGAKVIVR